MEEASTGDPPRRLAPTRELLVHQTKWFAAGQATGDVVWYAMLIILAALLPPEAFGTVAISMAIVRLANLLMESGTVGAVIAARSLTLQDVKEAERFNVSLGAVLTVVIAVSAGLMLPLVAEDADPDVLRVLAFAVVIGAFAIVPQALLRRTLNFRLVALVNMTAALTTAAAAVAAALAGAGVWALVIRQLLYQAVIAALARVVARPARASLPRAAATLRRGWRVRAGPASSTAFLVVGASGLAAMTLDNIVVGAVTDARRVGFYALAFTLGFAPLTQVSWRLGAVLFPAAAATEDLATVARRTARVMRMMTLVLWPIAVLAIAFAPAAVPAVFGSEWEPMVLPLQILLVVGVSHAVANVFAESLSGTGNIGFRAWCDAPWAVLTLLGVGALGAAFGIRGAAVAHLVTATALVGAYVVLGSARIGTSPGEVWRRVRGVLAPAVGQLGTTAGVLIALQSSDPWVASVVAAAAGLAVLVVLLASAPSRPFADLAEILRLMKRRRAPESAA